MSEDSSDLAHSISDVLLGSLKAVNNTLRQADYARIGHVSTDNGITDTERDHLLQMHNDLRRKLNNCTLGLPPVRGFLPDLEWDDELAKRAQSYVARCIDEPEPADERVTEDNEYYGQNGDTTDASSIDFWIESGNYYNIQTNACFNTRCVLYKQLIWQNTTKIGCAAKVCIAPHQGPLFVCNYAPSDPKLDTNRPYELGTDEDCGTDTPATTTSSARSIFMEVNGQCYCLLLSLFIASTLFS